MKSKKLLCALALCVVASQTSLQSIVHAQANSTDPQTVVNSHRLAGNDRYETSIAIARSGWTQSDIVILANGEQFADALCAGPLAKEYNAPILLTSSASVSDNTLKEIANLQAKKIVIIGCTGAISANVESQLKSAVYTDIDRIGGKDRFETSVMVAERLGKTDKVVIASGENYPDAESMAPIAAKLGMPILLSDKNTLPDKVKQYIESNNVKKTYIVGGEGVLSSTIEKAVPSSIRLGGIDRYATNVAVMKQFDKDLDFNNIYLAKGDGPSGNEFADALSGAALASETSSPILLTNNSIDVNMNQYIKSKLNLETKVIAIGGKAVVPDTLVKTLMDEKTNVPAAKVYNSSGIYSDGTISGSVVISAPGVYLKNTVINGDLLIASTVSDGNVDLDNVTVTGKTIVNGGGSHSIHFHNENASNVIIDKPLGEAVRLVADENAGIDSITVESGGIIDGSKSLKSGKILVLHNANLNLIGNFDTVKIVGKNSNVNIADGSVATLIVNNSAKNSTVNIAKNSTVQNMSINSDATISGEGQISSLSVESPNTNILLDGSAVTSLNITGNAQGSIVNIGANSKVNTLTANAQVNIEGQGIIESALVNANGVTLEQKPASVSIKSGVSTTVNGTIQTGTYSSGGSSSGGSGTYTSGGSSSGGSEIVTTSSSIIVKSVSALQDIYAPSGVTLYNIFAANIFPKTAEVTLSNNTTTNASIFWNGRDVTYDAINPPGVYTYVGFITLPQGVTNPNRLQAMVNIHLGASQDQGIKVASVQPINIHVAEGTTSGAIELPESVDLILSNNTTTSAAVTWDGGSPKYDGNIDRIYTFAGNISLPEGVSNSDNVKAKAYVSVGQNQAFSNILMPFDEFRDNVGNTYIKDTWNNQVVEFDNYGNIIRNLTGVTATTGHFSTLGAMTIDSLGNVYIVDWGNNRILEYDNNGNVVRILKGTGPYENFCDISSIAVDSSRNLYVADSYNKRIVEFNCNGNILRILTGTDENNPFGRAIAIKLDKSDNLYVADRFNERVVEFNSSGNFLRAFTGCNSVAFSLPDKAWNELITDDLGNIYVIDKGNARVVEFDSNGSFVRQFTGSDATHQFPSIVGAALDGSGNIYIAGDTFSVTEFDSNGTFVRNIDGINSINTFTCITDISVDNSGNLYVADYSNNLTSEFNPNGNLIKTWGRLVSSVAPLTDIHVAQGTTMSAINLPQSVDVTLDGNQVISVPVTWNLSSGIYNANIPGTYTLTGEIVTPTVMPNVAKNASINIIVDPATP